jgi:peroxiredoxin
MTRVIERPRFRLLALALLSLVLVGLVGCQGASDPSGGLARVGAPAPAVNLPTASGGQLQLASQSGKVVLLNFWATWCVPCRGEMPDLQRMADGLPADRFSLWAVNLQEAAAPVSGYGQELGLHFPLLLDDDGAVTRQYGVRALPATFLVDSKGVVRQQRLGPLVEGDSSTAWSRAWLEQQVQTLLAG